MAGAYPTRRGGIATILAFALIGAAACQVTPGLGTVGGFDHNVSGNAEEWGGYEQRGVYEVARDVFVMDVPDYTNGPALIPGREVDVPPGTFRGPTDVADYVADPGRWRGVLGTLPEGTRIRAETLRAKGNLRDRNVRRVYVKGDVMEGEFRGLAVDLQAVSIYRADPDGGPVVLEGPNPDLLREIR